MDQRELELFLHLARTLNYGRTSLECHVSAATLTRTIQRLEVRTGSRLFDRGPRGVVLTADGRRFSTYAEQVLACGVTTGPGRTFHRISRVSCASSPR